MCLQFQYVITTHIVELIDSSVCNIVISGVTVLRQCRNAPHPSCGETMKTFFFFGDSLTLGVNDRTMLGWTGRFAATLDLPVPPTTFYNLGVRKQTSLAVLARWKEEVLRRELPESDVRLLFNVGVVDMAAPKGEPVLSVEESGKALDKLLKEATHAYKKQVIRVLSPFPVVQEAHNERIATLNAHYAKVCAAKGIEYIDIYSILVENQAYMNDLHDGIHPTGNGCAIIAEFLQQAESIKKWIA